MQFLLFQKFKFLSWKVVFKQRCLGQKSSCFYDFITKIQDKYKQRCRCREEVCTINRKICTNAYIVTVDQERRILEQGYIIVWGMRIEAIVPMEEYPGANPEDEIIVRSNYMILAGLIDVHAHAGHSMFTLLGSASPSNWMPMMIKLYHHNTTEKF